MASWDSTDSKNNLLKKWLDSWRAAALPIASGSEYEWRVSDSDNNILAKILRNYSSVYSVPADAQYNWRPADSENNILRKILTVLHFGEGVLTDSSALSWRPIDGQVNILQKIVRSYCLMNVDTDGLHNAGPQDNEMWCLRKIVDQL